MDAIATRKGTKTKKKVTEEATDAIQDGDQLDAAGSVTGGGTEESQGGQDGTPEPKQEQEFTLQYDVNSQQRYVDSTSQKTDFERMLDELARISKDMLVWDVEKFTKKYHGDGDEAETTAKKYAAFLGGFITNAAMELYDHGYRDAAFQKLDQARAVLEAKRKLETEVEAIRSSHEDAVDLSDMMDLFGGGEDSNG